MLRRLKELLTNELSLENGVVITGRGLKLGGDAVAVGLSYVMGESLETSKYPSQWKRVSESCTQKGKEF